MTSPNLAPALITAGVSAFAALLSTILALVAINNVRRSDRDKRLQEVSLGVLPRRLDAYEKTWLKLTELERGVELEGYEIDALVCATIWMPERLRAAMLVVLLDNARDSKHIKELRRMLLEDTLITSVDVSMERVKE